VTARTLLDQGASRIETRLAGEPEVQSEMTNVIGNVYLSLSLYEEGQAMIERALALRRALPEPSDSAIAATLYDLGLAQQRRARYAEADSSYREALEIRQRIFGEDHPQVLHSLSSVGWVLHAQGSYAAAESLYVHVLAGHRASPDATADDLARAWYDLGSAKHMDGRLDEAGAHFREAIAALEADTIVDELAVASIKNDLAVLLKNSLEYDAAAPLYLDVLDIRRRYLGETHSLFAQSLNNYTVFLRASGDHAGADSVAVLALEAYRQSVGENHPEYGNALNSVAITHERRDDCAGAIERFLEAADIHDRAVNPDYWVPNAIRLNMSRCLIATQQYDEAERVLLTAHESLGRSLGIDADQTRRARDMLVDLYEAWGRPARAAEYRSSEAAGG